MSRSKHTDPLSIRAKRRIQTPYQPRGVGDLSLRRRLGWMLERLDEIAIPQISASGRTVHPLRILRQHPSPGFHHPICEQEILQFLGSIGPLGSYGLRSIELVRAPVASSPGSPLFGRYKVPGRILIFEQPVPPWRLPGLLGSKNARRFERAGAVVTLLPELGTTLVDWPADALRCFMLEEVLLHELGHHVLQYHKGKRLARIARTKDHEAFATLFAERQRSRLVDRKSSTR